MKLRKIKIVALLALLTIVAIGGALWIGRYPARYYLYLWQLNHAKNEISIMCLNGSIETISHHIVPLLVRTYENANCSQRSRTAAAIGLMCSDENKALALFREHEDEAIYPELYYYYLWRLNSKDGAKASLSVNEYVESISPHIIPLLVRTYEDVNESRWARTAAAYGLIKADRERAETLFLNFLEHKDDEIVSLAITHLGTAKSEKAFEIIVEFADHPNKSIRWAVADYLGNFSSAESINLLKEMADDPDGDVRSWAMVQLQDFGILPRPLTPSRESQPP